MRRAAFALLVAAAFAAAPASGGLPPGTFVRYPSGDVPDPASLQQFLFAHPEVSTIVFAKGSYLFPSTLLVFGREGLTLTGATGRPEDVVIESSDTPALQIEQSQGTTIRGITLRTTAAFGSALRLASVLSTDFEGYVDDTVVEDCGLEGYIGANAEVRARNLTLDRCRIRVTQAGGAAVLWEDGSGLFVTRTRMTAAPGVAATVGIFVRGAQTAESEGERARKILLTNNVVDGDFATGFDLADVTELRARHNRIAFPSSTLSADGGGRIGIVVRRAAASALTEDYLLLGNSVSRAHYGCWLLNTGQGAAIANRFRDCGSSSPDTHFSDTGGAMRLNLPGGVCGIEIDRNDLRGLKSPLSDPAVVVFPPGKEDLCFQGTTRNRVDRGRALYPGAPTTATRAGAAKGGDRP